MAELEWQEFAPATFDAARRTNRPVLLVLTQPWCQHSRELLETTLQRPDVLAEIERAWVPVRVDAERRPDVNERYGSGAWPTIAYLTPDGELLSNDGFLDADELVARLRKIDEFLKTHREEIDSGLKSLWSHHDGSGDAALSRGGKLNRQIVEDVVNAIYDRFDHQYGGWGESTKFPHSEAIDFALVQVEKHGDPRMREVVTVTLDRMAEGAIYDGIDGGFFRYSKTRDWRSPDHEKVLDANATRLRCYLEAFQTAAEPRYREVAEGIVRWMLRFMYDEETGAFFGAQAADADYYVLTEEDRRRREPPKVDRTIYTNANSAVVSALFKASIVLGDATLRDRAMGTLEFLLEKLFNERDGVFHYWDGTYHLPGMLSDQAYLIRALIDAAQHTGDSDLLLPAERIAEMVIERQRAPGGGFWDILNDRSQRGSMRRRNRSILENSLMAESLVRLSFLSRRPEFHDEAVATLEAFTGDYKEYGYYVAGYGRAVDLIFYQPLTITIVGDRDSVEADALRRAALAPYVPSRIVQMLDPRHDPVLLGRAKFAIEDRPVAHLALGSEAKATAHTPDDLLERIRTLELERR